MGLISRDTYLLQTHLGASPNVNMNFQLLAQFMGRPFSRSKRGKPDIVPPN